MPPPREKDTDQGPHDETSVDGEAAFPDREDLPRIGAVVVPVEDHLVQTGADQAGQDRPLRNADDVVRRQLLATRLAMAEPQRHDDQERHQDAVPADDHRAEEGSGPIWKAIAPGECMTA